MIGPVSAKERLITCLSNQYKTLQHRCRLAAGRIVLVDPSDDIGYFQSYRLVNFCWYRYAGSAP